MWVVRGLKPTLPSGLWGASRGVAALACLAEERLSENFGALIHVPNTSLPALRCPDVGRELRGKWLERRLLVIRGLQDMTPDDLVTISSHFGPLGPVPAGRAHASLGPGASVLRIGNVRDAAGNLISQPSSSKDEVLGRDGSSQYRPHDRLPVWHTDGTFKETPEAGTALFCRQAPPRGGATCFADAVAAWEALPPEQQQRLETLDCICSLAHHDAKIRKRNPDYPMLKDEERCKNPPRRVPLCLEHPETHRRAIYGINSSTCCIVEKGQDMCPTKLRHYEESGDEDESVAILRDLLVHATAPDFTISWQWQPGDFAICDTRSTMHCATSYDQRFTREMWRTTIMPGLFAS
ncbi:tauD [Symbiodinium natans]|uniref:TauD protein n=1 Tax=Symbiodinium natans TaxID=878477 RepID=A0A812J0N8_9DINO|nr:tauD [Symbiodinium natans]